MGNLTVEYPGGHYDSDLGLVCTRYAKQGKVAVVWPLFRNGTRAKVTIKMILPEIMSDEMKATLKKCYAFERWHN